MTIRKQLIYNKIFDIYLNITPIKFPIDPIKVLCLKENLRILPYSVLAKINNCELNELITLLGTKFGSSHYDLSKNRYLVLYNDFAKNHYDFKRIRWTLAHEAGHVFLRHHNMLNKNTVEPSILLEQEADFFAATLLAPFPLFDYMGIKSPHDIQTVFGLSINSSRYRFKDYLTWKNRKKDLWRMI